MVFIATAFVQPVNAVVWLRDLTSSKALFDCEDLEAVIWKESG